VTLVSVITATWGRPRTILEHAVPSVAAQTYPDIEHIVVTDGYDPSLYDVLSRHGYSDAPGSRKRLVCLGRNWTGFSGDGAQGSTPRLVGTYLATGEYITYLDDDDDYLPHHVEAIAAALSGGAELVCTAWQGHPGLPSGTAPGVGTTGTSMMAHHVDLLKQSTWMREGYESDGRLAERWIAGGARWVFLPEPTVLLNGHRVGAPDT
jgi:glycosyltransferase involved in cell wall biosynthesis